MALIDGKQVRDDSLSIAKLKNDAGQGTILFATGTNLGITDAPINDTDLVNKLYADSLASGLDPKQSARFTTTADLSGTYNSGGGAGTTGSFTNVDLQASSSVFDLTGAAVTPAIGDRVLVKNQTDSKQNGIYEVLTVSATGTMQRADDHDGSPTNEVSGGNFCFVETGTTYGGTGWVLTGDGDLGLNVDNLVWVQFSDASALTGGAGISISSSIASVDLNDNTLEFDTGGNSGQLRVNLAVPGTTEIGIEGSNGLVLKRSDITDTIIATNGILETIDGNGDITLKAGGELSELIQYDGLSTHKFEIVDTDGFTAGVDGGGVFIMNTTNATFTDNSAGSNGIVYAADYSATYTTRSLVDKAYVDSVAESSSAGNGLTKVDELIKLGGALTEFTAISGNTGEFGFQLEDVGDFTADIVAGGAVDINVADIGSFQMNTGQTKFTDVSAGSNGIVYTQNYSATFVDRSLVDKGYVDAAVGAIGDLTTASNGLTETGNDIRLGGALTEDTTIDGVSGTYNFTVSDVDILSLGDFGGHTLVMNGTNATFNDASITKTGIVYGADYSGSFVNRSLVDKEYVDLAVGAIGDLTTASNGLTETGNDIKLGGALTEATSITGASAFDITTTGTQTYSSDDTMVIESLSDEVQINGGGVSLVGSSFVTISSASTLALATSSGYALNMNGTATFTDTGNLKGIEYAADYGTNFTDRSLVDKAYVDNNSAVGTVSDKDQTATATTSDFDTTGTSITLTPNNDGFVEVLVNGQQQVLGDGVKTKDCYFSSDGGTTARSISAITAADTLYWVGSVAGFQLTATDRIDFNYQA